MNTRSKSAAFVRGLASLAVLLALVAAIPYVLVRIGVLPHRVPTAHEVLDALTSPDSGQLFLGAITLIGWYGWLSFTVSVAVEAVSAARQRKAPKLRMLGGAQRLAGTLIGGILLLLPASGAFAASPATAATQPAVTANDGPAAADRAAATVARPTGTSHTHTGPVHHVKAGDTLWEIAEQRLGSGTRWREIVDANMDVAQGDGTRITEDTTELQPGWTLRLPADATKEPAGQSGGIGGRTQTDHTTAEDSTHLVRPGETLSSIAEDELGDAHAYPQIAELNKGAEQPDGRALSDPDEIYPGWRLQIPAPTRGEQTSSPPRAEQPTPPEEDHDEGSQHTDKQEGGPGSDASASPHPSAPPNEQTESPAPRESHQAPAPKESPEAPTTDRPASDAPTASGQDTSADSELTSMRTVAAAGSILAAAVLAVIATRRARQQRRRRAKRRIPMPAGATAAFEKQLRVTSDISGTELADRALRTLAANCRAASRPLPELEAMRITPRGLELHLAAATPPIAPFTERDDSPVMWWCPARGAALLDQDEAADITPPYPALVSLGETEDGDPVLVDLETIGLLRLDGTTANVRAVMLALAVELSSSQLAANTQIVLAGAGSDLQTLYPDQIDHHTQLDRAVAELQAHDAFQRAALADGGTDHLRAARLSDETSGDTWIPRILVSTTPPTGASGAVLEDLLTSRPRTSVAVVTATATDLNLPGAWTLPVRPGSPVDLPGLGLSVKLQYLDDTSYDRLVQLLVTSSRPDDVPPPPWTRRPAALDDENGPLGTVDDAPSALAAETTSAAPSINTALAAHDASQPARPPGELATATPDFASMSPAGAQPTFDVRSPTEPSDDAEGDYGSALAPAVSGAPKPVEPGDDPGPRPAPDEGDARAAVSAQARPEADAVGDGVDDQADTDAEFGTLLNEVLAEARATPPYKQAGATDEDASALSSSALGQPGHPPARRPERRIVPRPSAATSNVLAALSAPPDPPGAPQIQVLGPVNLVGTLGRVESNRRNGLLEIASWLALHPGLSRQDLDDAIWPGIRILSDTRNTAISKLRAWLGRDPLLPADDPQAAYLPPVKDGIYSFNDDVTSDWSQFQELYQMGMHHDGPPADIALAQALALVRGRPFSDIDPAKYTWAEAHIQEMISAIVDVAHELAERRRHVRDYRAAAQAVTKGLTCDAQSELLYRDLFTICHEMGDKDGLERAAHRLARINVENGCDSSPETVGLLRTLLKGERHQAHHIFGSAAS